MKVPSPQWMARGAAAAFALLLTCLPAGAEASGAAPATEPQVGQPGQVDMGEMMKTAARFTQPGEPHKLLARLIGEWDTQTRITMPGSETSAEKGVSTCSWLMEGRWLQCRAEGSMMGMPMTSFVVMGYDNFKMSYRVMTVSSMDTAMNTSEGDLDQHGRTLLTHGTLDEYLTGEHDKMVKYVWRFLTDDRVVLEVHDLPIGESGTKVVEIVYNRRKAS